MSSPEGAVEAGPGVSAARTFLPPAEAGFRSVPDGGALGSILGRSLLEMLDPVGHPQLENDNQILLSGVY